MKKDICELFNEIDIEVNSSEEMIVSDLEKEKIKRKLRNEIREPMNPFWKIFSIKKKIIIYKIWGNYNECDTKTYNCSFCLCN